MENGNFMNKILRNKGVPKIQRNFLKAIYCQDCCLFPVKFYVDPGLDSNFTFHICCRFEAEFKFDFSFANDQDSI